MFPFCIIPGPFFPVIADVVSNFAITVVLSGRTKNQHVFAHSGQRTIFGWRKGTQKMMMMIMMMMMMIMMMAFYSDGYQTAG